MSGHLGDDPLINLSYEELRYILRWAIERGPGTGGPRIVLIGGWAVHVYNAWGGSIDIDLVMNARVKGTLMMHLRSERGYSKVGPEHMAGQRVQRTTPFGPVKIDIASFELYYPFEGTGATLPMRQLRTESVEMGLEGMPVHVPARAMLLVMKMKAAWDRQWRLDHGKSVDSAWETGKVIKDLADILALVDPDRGGTGLSVPFLGRQLEEYPFLRDVLARAGSDPLGAGRYRIPQERASAMVERLLGLVSPPSR